MKGIIMGALMTAIGITGAAADLAVTAPATIGRYQVIEFTITHPETGLANVWEDVTIRAEFRSPLGDTIRVGGFYHSTNTWKVRFAPWVIGQYNWTIKLTAAAGEQSATGSFQCAASGERGFVRRHATNPFRLVFEDGSLYNALGIGACMLDAENDGSITNTNWGLDGGDRSAGGSERSVDMETYLDAMAGEAGFNIFRWSVNNCAFNMWQSIGTLGNRYLVKESNWGDTICQKLRTHGMRIYLDIFGWQPAFSSQWNSTPEMNAVKRYVDYMVARYGAYVDFWEVCNETSPPDQWISLVAAYIKSIDPYKHMVSASWERPALPEIDIASPHWYEKEAELESDTRMITEINKQRGSSKPIIFGEQGNSVQNWDPLSALRARIRSWTAFFKEGHLIFWESNFAKDYKSGAANLYIGPPERAFFNALQKFTKDIPSDVTMENITCSPAGSARAYGLRSSKGVYVYLRDAQSIANTSTGKSFAIALSTSGTAQWYDTKTGTVINEAAVAAGSTVMSVPSFVCDIALRITYDGITGTGEKASGGKWLKPVRTRQPSELFDIRGRLITGGNGRTNERKAAALRLKRGTAGSALIFINYK